VNIPLFKPPRLKGKYLGKVLKSRWLTTGPMCERLKEALAQKFNWDKDLIVLANSATAGWQAILDHTPSPVWQRWDTFVSMRDAQDAHVEQEMPGWEQINVRTFVGGLEDIPEWPYAGLRVADCTHLGHPWTDVDYSLLSFYPTKPIPGAEGGAVFCKVREDADRLAKLVDCGFGSQPRDYRTRCWGRKANMTDVQAAFALEALEISDEYMAGLKEAWGRMLEEHCRFNYIPGSSFVDVGRRPYLFQLVLPGNRPIPEVQKMLPFPTGWHFPPNRRLTLPMWPNMLGSVIKKIFNELEKLEL